MKNRRDETLELAAKITFHPDDCCMQPAGIVHNEIQCSSDFECLELYSPAVHDTVQVEAK